VTQGELLNIVADELLDTAFEANRTRYGRALQRAAEWVSRLLGRHQSYNVIQAYEDFTTTALTTTYSLTATDIVRVYKMEEIDDDDLPVTRCRQVTADVAINHTSYENGEYVFFLTRSKTTGLYSVNFPDPPGAGLEFRVTYIARVGTVASWASGNDDNNAFVEIPEEYHELIGVRAAWLIAGAEESQPSLTSKMAELRAEALNDMGAMTNNDRVEDGWG